MPRGPDCKGPTVGWTCKQFTYYNRNIGDNGEHATIYFAKSPHGEILVNWYARGGSMFELAHTHKRLFSEGLDTSPCVLQVQFMTVMLRVYSAEAERYIDPL